MIFDYKIYNNILTDIININFQTINYIILDYIDYIMSNSFMHVLKYLEFH